MNAVTLETPRSDTLSTEVTLAALAVAHYEQVYALCHAFYDDPGLCLNLTNQWFQDSAAAPDLATVCRRAVQALSRRPNLPLPIPSCGRLTNLAWLLKDAAGLRYADIGAVLDMDVEQVKFAIAEAREAALAFASDLAAA